jgi:hypothetical protein
VATVRARLGILLLSILSIAEPGGSGRRVDAAAGTVVSGTVSGGDRGFLSGAAVVLKGERQRETHTDADGRFTFVEVARGRYEISVTAEGYLPLDRPMDVGDASVSVDIVLLRIPVVP